MPTTYEYVKRVDAYLNELKESNKQRKNLIEYGKKARALKTPKFHEKGFIQYDNDIQMKPKVKRGSFDKTFELHTIPNRDRLISFITLLNQYSIDEIKQLKLINERTFYRFTAVLKRLNITKASANCTLKGSNDYMIIKELKNKFGNSLNKKEI